MRAGANLNDLALGLAGIAAEAGEVLNRFRQKICAQSIKPDGSVVSEADQASEALIVSRLAEAFPTIPVVSEENAESHGRDPGRAFFLVDPLDGTRAFLNGAPDFCVLIAHVVAGVPVAGAIHAPATGESWWAGAAAFHAANVGLEKATRMAMARVRNAGLVAIISSEFAAEASGNLCAGLKLGKVLKENSALKFARVAEGIADFYPRIGRTMQWDIAAGDALLRALGGGVFDLSGQKLTYGPRPTGWDNPDFVALAGLPPGDILRACQGTMSRLT